MDKYFELSNLKIVVLGNYSVSAFGENSHWSYLVYKIPGIKVYEYGGGLQHCKLSNLEHIDLVCFYIQDIEQRQTGKTSLSFLENELRMLKNKRLPQSTPFILHYKENSRPDTGKYTFAHELIEESIYNEYPSSRLKKLADELLFIYKKILKRGMGLFISYSWADRQFAQKLVNDLKKSGIRIWIDQSEIKLGDSLIQKIREGIDQVDYVAVLLSNASINSTWVQKEVDIAMNQEIEGKRVKVLPLLLEDIDLPWFLKRKLFADFRDKSQYRRSIRLILDRMDL